MKVSLLVLFTVFFCWGPAQRFDLNDSFRFVSDEKVLPTDRSFSSWVCVHKVDPGEIRKIPIGCVSLGLPSKVMIILLEF
jgi:hypothetical protein